MRVILYMIKASRFSSKCSRKILYRFISFFPLKFIPQEFPELLLTLHFAKILKFLFQYTNKLGT